MLARVQDKCSDTVTTSIIRCHTMCSSLNFFLAGGGAGDTGKTSPVCLIAPVLAGNSRYSGNATGAGLEQDSFQTTQLHPTEDCGLLDYDTM
jgi:hypothetical protein